MRKDIITVLLVMFTLYSFGQSNIELENLGPNVNTEYSELSPRISADGKILYFIVSDHPQNNKYGIEELAQDIWYSEKGNDGEWGKATQAAYPLNQDAYNGVNWVAPDGNRILIKGYYENGKYISRGISMCKKTKSGWSVPIGQKINNFEKMNIGVYQSIFMTDDAKTLILSFSETKNSLIQNLYFSQLVGNGSWSQPISLGKLFKSSIYTYHSPFLASDGVTLFFASDRPGGLGDNDIWMCRRLDNSWQNWSNPINLGAPINSPGFQSGFTVDATGEYGYMVSDYNSFGLDDIVRVRLGENVKPNPVVLLHGNVYNSKTKEPLSASLLYESLPDGKNAGNAYSSPVDGSYKLVLTYGKNYSLRASAGNFIAVSENLDLMKAGTYKEIRKDLYLVPMEKGQVIRLNSIFFDFGKATLRTESFPELDRLLTILQENPKLEIELGGHTDNVGNDANNLKLSGERANAVLTYLNYRGIPVNRISAKGYGKTKPVAANDTEEGRQLNRRVEYTILGN